MLTDRSGSQALKRSLTPYTSSSEVFYSLCHPLCQGQHDPHHVIFEALRSSTLRLSQKVMKPQFFDSFRTERDNVGKLDIASAHIAKKAVTASNVLAEKPLNLNSDQAAWGGILPRSSLVTEMIPMMIKIQSASKSESTVPRPALVTCESFAEETAPLLPSSVQTLQLPRYTTSSFNDTGMVIDEKSDLEGADDYDGSTLGEDGLGVLPHQAGVWDDVPDVAEKEDEEDGLEGDDIQDWD